MPSDRVYVNTDELRALGADLAKTGRDLAIGVSAESLAVATEIAQMAQSIALSYPSTSQSPDLRTGGAEGVAASIRAVPTGVPGRAEVQAGGDGIPLAGLWELGNKGTDANADTFWHPVFQRAGRPNVRVDQSKWPYLRMAVDQYTPRIESRMTVFLNRIFRKHRL